MHGYFCILATKVELYVGDASVATDDRLPALNQARFTRLGYVCLGHTCIYTVVHFYFSSVNDGKMKSLVGSKFIVSLN